ncbi:flavodoxin family protein [Desulfovibrio sp. TomC]|uniref:flavodoxin family protein n=1 Tax=Desulfovibrio sp. TomC TaxID=1562888 RepID=UPI0005744190|nr:flavodoxin family protein [Desulfovibrio sp. TomC]KHK00202.1 Iron-sulfur flavoprotein [Desulfovibrio sp. TomC]
MAKKIAFILGSPRKKSNTNVLAREAMRVLAEARIAAVEIDAPRLDFKHPGCVACYKCQQSTAYGCHIKDGLGQAVSSLVDYDAIVLATPLYWLSYPAQLKMFIDRMFSLLKFGEKHEFFSPLMGKPLALLATAASGLEDNLDLLDTLWRTPTKKIEAPYLSCLFPFCQYPPGEVAKDADAMSKAAAFGQQLASLLT